MNDKSIPRLRFSEFTDEWEQRKLGDIVGIYDGVHQTPDYQDEGIMFLSVENIATMTSEKYISEEAFNRDYKVYPEKGDILMTRIGDVGTPNVVETEEKLAFYVSLALLKPRGVDSYFLNNAIQSSSFQHGLRERTLLTAVPMKINKDEIGKVDISLPLNIKEQEKIGESFKRLDNLITLHQRKCNSLKELRDGIIQRILSRELRFKRTDGSEFENWVTKELSEIFTERKISQTITEDAPLLSFTIEQGVINPQDKKTNKRDFLIKDKDTKKFALTEVDDIIYNPANLKYGAIHRNKLMRGVVSPIYAIFYTEQNPAFMEYVVKNPTFIKNSLKYLEGTVIKLMTLKPKDFLRLKVEIPASLEEQKIIADFLMQFDGTIDAEQRRIEKWKELKKGLIQQMFI